MRSWRRLAIWSGLLGLGVLACSGAANVAMDGAGDGGGPTGVEAGVGTTGGDGSAPAADAGSDGGSPAADAGVDATAPDGEAPDASDDAGVVIPCEAGTDPDKDNVCAGDDNCPNVRNPTQSDRDKDGIGNACDTDCGPLTDDCDDDGVLDANDNCPGVPNANQADADLDGVGDACETAHANCVAVNNGQLASAAGVDLRGCAVGTDAVSNFTGADLSCGKLNGNFLGDKDYTNARLRRVVVSANWLGANVYTGADLREIAVCGSNWTSADNDFTDADLSGALVRGSNWSGRLIRTKIGGLGCPGSNLPACATQTTGVSECPGLDAKPACN